MLKQIKLAEAVGKTIQATTDCSNEQIIVFTDGTFTYQVAYIEYNMVGFNEPEFKILDFYYEDAIKAGVYTREEYEKAKEEQEIKRKMNQDERDRAEFERLEKKFGKK